MRAAHLRPLEALLMPSIEEVEATDAGAHLFNGITRMHLVDRDGHPLLFSARRRLTHQVIGLLLEAGITPEDMTSRMFKVNNQSNRTKQEDES